VFPCPFLVAGPGYAGLYDPGRHAVGILDTGFGDYYGITWSATELYLLARQGGAGELIRVLRPDGSLDRTLSIGREIDGHQILFHQGALLITATREDGLIRLDPGTGEQEIWNWTGHDTDTHHINGLAPGPDGTLIVSHDNHWGTPSEIVTLSPDGREILDRITPTDPEWGTHNIEDRHLVVSGENSMLMERSDAGDWHPVFRREGEFFRGLGRCRLPDGSLGLLVGASGIMPREFRSLPQTAWVHLLAGQSPAAVATVAIPEIGQVYEVRSLDPAASHHGIPCPLQLDGDLAIAEWRDAPVTGP
jgi:hypothetical protein